MLHKYKFSREVSFCGKRKSRHERLKHSPFYSRNCLAIGAYRTQAGTRNGETRCLGHQSQEPFCPIRVTKRDAGTLKVPCGKVAIRLSLCGPIDAASVSYNLQIDAIKRIRLNRLKRRDRDFLYRYVPNETVGRLDVACLRQSCLLPGRRGLPLFGVSR